MAIRFILALAALLGLLLVTPASTDNLLHNPPKSTWTGRRTLTWLDGNNEVRYVDVYIPTSFKKSKEKLPVVMWFMGSRVNVRKDYHYLGICYDDCDIAPYAEKNGFMLVVIDQKHEKGRGWECQDSDTLDETLILDVLAYLKKTFPIDDSRIYLWGISAGGKLSQFFAVKHSDIITAVVSFSGVINAEFTYYADMVRHLKESPRKFPIIHWQTEGDYEDLIKDMKGMLRLYRDAGYPVEFVWLNHMPDRKLKHEWYADLYNQKMWDWCKQFRFVDGKTVTESK